VGGINEKKYLSAGRLSYASAKRLALQPFEQSCQKMGGIIITELAFVNNSQLG
jgi:hypothetical protein